MLHGISTGGGRIAKKVPRAETEEAVLKSRTDIRMWLRSKTLIITNFRSGFAAKVQSPERVRSPYSRSHGSAVSVLHSVSLE
jgi:hypothetical protein